LYKCKKNVIVSDCICENWLIVVKYKANVIEEFL